VKGGARPLIHAGSDGGASGGEGTYVRQIDITGDRAVIDHGTLGSNNEWGKRLRHGQHAEDIDLEHSPPLVDVGVQDGHDEAGAGVVDEVVQRPASLGLNGIDGSSDAGGRGHVEGEQGDVRELFEVYHLRERAGCGEDVEAALLECCGQGEADAASAAAGDEDRFGSHWVGRGGGARRYSLN